MSLDSLFKAIESQEFEIRLGVISGREHFIASCLEQPEILELLPHISRDPLILVSRVKGLVEDGFITDIALAAYIIVLNETYKDICKFLHEIFDGLLCSRNLDPWSFFIASKILEKNQ